MHGHRPNTEHLTEKVHLIKSKIDFYERQLSALLQEECTSIVGARVDSVWSLRKSPIHTLPPEVLLVIFRAVSRHHENTHLALLPLCAVCRQWAALITSTPSIWRLVVVAVNRALPLHGLQKYLVHSQNETLDIVLYRDDNPEVDYFESSRVAYIIQYLGYAMDRWHSLELRLAHFEAARVAFTNCRGRAYALREITIACSSFGLDDTDEEDFREWNTGFEAPAVKNLTLIGETLFWIGQANVRWINTMSRLEKLSLTDYGMDTEPLISTAHLSRILRFGAIRRSVRILEFKNLHVEELPMMTHPDTIMESLRVVSIIGGSPETAGLTILCLNAPSLQRIQVNCTTLDCPDYLQKLTLPFCELHQCHRFPLLSALHLTKVRIVPSDLGILDRCHHLALTEMEDVDDSFMLAMSTVQRGDPYNPRRDDSTPFYYLSNLQSLVVINCPNLHATSIQEMIRSRRHSSPDVLSTPAELSVLSVIGGHELSAEDGQWFNQNIRHFQWD
ncbi:hypothetical protein AMATHDRAFT_9424 [Amanita thiersii Skay4041]|uniref:F-box domain-containing protein n=1 Tax=Amanita thiersii Skay4041 TaxID=703135 RepID=A0A2A9N693_9AGAR|nr:hypothetical protein AMATHDRAFT_9424 [Amanita thiersii Skay4041]